MDSPQNAATGQQKVLADRAVELGTQLPALALPLNILQRALEVPMGDAGLIYWLAFSTFALVFAVLIWQRVQVHRAKQTGERSTFTDTHGGEPRPQVGLGHTQMEAQRRG
ncbi:hypothetical protein M446_5657 [Methylobacterium sp. 4-46]|uniref:hypothetical protein n=1 Tax=unclassified Methylobacterium TaxID=2615210 RepID=UPI000152DA8A|nr:MULTISPECIES: hypothetical protein [Methylobacterium]ACA19950.1 hypothetical protein M446_5657 [Methylobacterium sp. 4-46]WFT79136.1 hypothetical protein QA634_28540 [Methylobacterium nodulans]